MNTLYHIPFSANCRLVRIALTENDIPFRLIVEAEWERRQNFIAINPEGKVPVLVLEDNKNICGTSVIIEWLDEVGSITLIGTKIDIRCESRRIMNWFFNKFGKEVDDYIVYEKIMKGFIGKGNPDANVLRAGRKNLQIHLKYIDWLSKNRDWLAGNEFTIADISAAANISIIDYLGEIKWKEFPNVKDWYARIKSRPSFRSILLDKIPGLLPPKYYMDLDF